MTHIFAAILYACMLTVVAATLALIGLAMVVRGCLRATDTRYW